MISGVCAIAATEHEAERNKQAGMLAVIGEIRAKQEAKKQQQQRVQQMVPHDGDAAAHLEDAQSKGGCSLM